MSQFTKFRRQVIESFNAGQPVTTIGFYNLIETPLLEKIRTGLERDFDAVSSRQSPRSADWITTRLHIINHILEGRREQKAGEPERFHPFRRGDARINRSVAMAGLTWPGLLVVQTPFDERLTWLATMLMLVVGFAFMSRFLGPIKPKQPKRKKSDVANLVSGQSSKINHFHP